MPDFPLFGDEHVRQYQLHLIAQGASWSRFNQAVCALRFLYRFTLQRPGVVEMIPFAKRPRALPAVLSQAEVAQLIGAAARFDDRFAVLLQIAYGCGLRLAELTHLKVADIDSARRVLHVKGGKGARDRLVPLSPVLLERLRDYWRTHRPCDWLFPGARPGRRARRASPGRPRPTPRRPGTRRRDSPTGRSDELDQSTLRLAAALDIALGHRNRPVPRELLDIAQASADAMH